MRHVLLLLPAWMAAGCVKPVPVPQASQPTDVAVVYALGLSETGAVEGMPDGLQQRIEDALADRNLVPATLPAPEAFSTIRTPTARLDAIDGTSSPVLLVSCDPRFDVQVNGRFRWTVPCDIAMGAVVGHIEPAAHLVYYHQGEADAVTEVQTQVARETQRVLDQWLSRQ